MYQTYHPIVNTFFLNCEIITRKLTGRFIAHEVTRTGKHKTYQIARANTVLGEPTVRPEPAPTLKGKCAKEFVKQMERPPSVETIRIFKEAERVSRKIKQVK